ncbi:MAG: sigma 54-interacting transcriptional regulator [Pseudomonadota bacterium]
MKVIATADNRSTRRTPAGRLPASTEQEKNAEALLRTRTAELTERIKELNCLYGISNLFETQGVSLPWILQRAVELIPTAWQYPENASARILLDDQVFNTNGFKQTALKQGAEIVVNGLTVGRVEVFYPETDAVSEDGPFLEEERRLLNAISERLSKIIWLKRSEDYLRENEERYRIVTEQVAEGVALVQDGRFCYVNPAFCAFFELGRPEAVIAESVSALKTGATADIRMVYGSLRSDDCFEKSETVLSFIRNGRTCWYQICHSPITFRGKPAILSTFKDVSEIKAQEIAASRKAESLHRENLALKSTLKDRYRFGDIIGKSSAIQEVYELILKAATTDASVVIFGESGTGKELVARAIHGQDGRRKGQFVAVNCGAVQETLFEREFFGHSKGAFSGAHAKAPGFLDLADGGTLFLDEVGELTSNMQVKLLRAIDGGGYCPVGNTKPRFSDFRVISASNRPFSENIHSGRMRDDFFFRIQVIQINLPPLRERKEDIPLLVEHFLKTNRNRTQAVHVPGSFFDRLTGYDWPGNVRELRNVLQRYVTLNRLEFFNLSQVSDSTETSSLKIRKAVARLEESLLSKAIEQAGGNRTRAAELLGISRRALFRKVKTYRPTKAPHAGENAHTDKPIDMEE